MSAYNKVNDEWCGHHTNLLREVAKEEWGFEGFVTFDFVFGIYDGQATALGGLDIEMPITQHYGSKSQRLFQEGKVSEAVIDEAVHRILRQKIRFAQIGEPHRYGKHAVVSEAHKSLAREVAHKSIVLLKNDPPEGVSQHVPPIERSQVKLLTVIGTLAAIPSTA